MKRLNINSRREHKRFMKQFSKDLRKAYENTDYSNYKIEVAYDAEDNTLIIPMTGATAAGVPSGTVLMLIVVIGTAFFSTTLILHGAPASL